MDKNNDGIIDDLLIGSRPRNNCGRKPLGLSKEDREKHDKELRKARDARRKRKEKMLATEELVSFVRQHDELPTDKLATLLVDNPKWKIKYNPRATAISGAANGRIRRAH